MTSYDYDLFTIGAGSGGVRASRMAAAMGARVAVAEERYMGGTCVNVGCIPKKLFAYASHYGDDFDDAVGFGWHRPVPSFDWPTLVANKDKEILRLNGIYDRLLTAAGVTVLRARARVLDPHAVEVDGRRISARHILVATGVNWTRWITSPIAWIEGTLDWKCSSTTTAPFAASLTPASARPSPAVCGARPVAYRTVSTSTRLPSENWHASWSPRRSIAVM